MRASEADFPHSMTQLFTPRADLVFRIVLAVGLGLPALTVAGLMFLARSPLATLQFETIAQPLQFDHRHHAGDEKIECRYCHRTAETSPYAGIPATEVCMGCHAQIWNKSALLGLVRAKFFRDEPLVWNRVHRLPDFVYFDHSAHVSKGVGCATCHGRVDMMPLVARTVPLTMGWCLDCHRNPGPSLRPKEFITDMNWHPPEDGPALARTLLASYHVHTRTDCTACHR